MRRAELVPAVRIRGRWAGDGDEQDGRENPSDLLRWSRPCDEVVNAVHERVELVRQPDEVILARQFDHGGTWYPVSDVAGALDGGGPVAGRVHDEGWRADQWQRMAHVDLQERTQVGARGAWARRRPLEPRVLLAENRVAVRA